MEDDIDTAVMQQAQNLNNETDRDPLDVLNAIPTHEKRRVREIDIYSIPSSTASLSIYISISRLDTVLN